MTRSSSRLLGLLLSWGLLSCGDNPDHPPAAEIQVACERPAAACVERTCAIEGTESHVYTR